MVAVILLQWDRAGADLSKVLEVVNEIGQLARFVNFITGRHYAFGQRTRTAGEDAYFGDLRRILIIYRKLFLVTL